MWLANLTAHITSSREGSSTQHNSYLPVEPLVHPATTTNSYLPVEALVRRVAVRTGDMKKAAQILNHFCQHAPVPDAAKLVPPTRPAPLGASALWSTRHWRRHRPLRREGCGRRQAGLSSCTRRRGCVSALRSQSPRHVGCSALRRLAWRCCRGASGRAAGRRRRLWLGGARLRAPQGTQGPRGPLCDIALRARPTRANGWRCSRDVAERCCRE